MDQFDRKCSETFTCMGIGMMRCMWGGAAALAQYWATTTGHTGEDTGRRRWRFFHRVNLGYLADGV